MVSETNNYQHMQQKDFMFLCFSTSHFFSLFNSLPLCRLGGIPNGLIVPSSNPTVRQQNRKEKNNMKSPQFEFDILDSRIAYI